MKQTISVQTPAYFRRLTKDQQRREFAALPLEAKIEKIRKPKDYVKAEEVFLQLHYATGAMLHNRNKETLNDVRERIFRLECDFDRGQMADLFAPWPWNTQYEYQKCIVQELARGLRHFSDQLFPTASQAGRDVPYSEGCDI